MIKKNLQVFDRKELKPESEPKLRTADAGGNLILAPWLSALAPQHWLQNKSLSKTLAHLSG